MRMHDNFITGMRTFFSHIFHHRRKTLREVVIPTLFGVTLGVFFGFLLTIESGDDVIDAMRIIKSEEAESNRNFGLRCVIIIHPQSAKPTNIVQAMRDGFTKECNETLFFTTDEALFKQLNHLHPIVYIDSFSNEFFWNFYQKVMEFSSADPMQWTYIGDEQTYLMVANLRKTLRKFNSRENILLGRITTSKSFLAYLFPLLSFEKVLVQSGIVVSSGALDKLVSCRLFWLPRSTESALYMCGKYEGLEMIDPVDEEGMHMLNDKPPSQLIAKEKSFFSSLVSSNSTCCSDSAITFGQTSVNEMRVIEYGIHFRVFGKAGYSVVDKPSTTSTISTTTTETTISQIDTKMSIVASSSVGHHNYPLPKRVEPVLRGRN
ncbi:unnamed protein product [Caenorhabditis auriculariae]|uniref:Uncharacterized protein n=1 Tax=Caenorhabditis auriculariae TaxID=2777116 RepID=A0A8S1HLI1_9PELO|nr:unnamed protein product [Caenorhabditis auriculariae]